MNPNKRPWKFAVPPSGPTHSASTNLGVHKRKHFAAILGGISTAIATLAAVLSLWVAQRQSEIQATQAKLEAEQVALAKKQARFQALQSLPELNVRRTFTRTSFDTKLEVCGTTSGMRSVSGLQALWLPEFGRYPLPSPDPTRLPRVRVALVPKDGVTWTTWKQATKGSSGDWSASPMLGNECASTPEPSPQPIFRFLHAHGRQTSKFGYWHKDESMVVVHQRDSNGTVYLRHYLFTHERADSAELLSEDEGEAWVANYESARGRRNEAIMSGPDTDISHIQGFFK